MKRLLVFSLAACLLATALGVTFLRPQKPDAGAVAREVRVVRDELQLLFPDGLTSDAGQIDSPRELEYAVGIVNESSLPLELSLLQVATPCCTTAKIVSQTGVLAKGERGNLRFRMKIGGRPGQNISRVPIALALQPSSADSAPTELFAVQLGYTLHSRGLVNWSVQEIDFGDVWPQNGNLTRKLELTLQYEDAQREVDVELAVAQPGLSLEQTGERSDSGQWDKPARIKSMICMLDASQLACGEYVSGVVAHCASGDQTLPIRWRVVDEYLFFPEGKLLVPRSPGGPATCRLNVRHAGGRKFRVDRASFQADGVRADKPSDELASESLLMLQATPDANLPTVASTLQLTLVREDGETCTRELALEFVDLP
jgi:hypothetical protein